jgi:hypothetical protein
MARRTEPRTRYWIVHWLDALTWPASLVLKGIRTTARTVGRVIRRRPSVLNNVSASSRRSKLAAVSRGSSIIAHGGPPVNDATPSKTNENENVQEVGLTSAFSRSGLFLKHSCQFADRKRGCVALCHFGSVNSWSGLSWRSSEMPSSATPNVKTAWLRGSQSTSVCPHCFLDKAHLQTRKQRMAAAGRRGHRLFGLSPSRLDSDAIPFPARVRSFRRFYLPSLRHKMSRRISSLTVLQPS